MNYDDDTYYIEFYINGLVKVDSKNKKEKLKKIQKLLNKILNDEDVDLERTESSLAIMSEEEVIAALGGYPEEDLIN